MVVVAGPGPRTAWHQHHPRTLEEPGCTLVVVAEPVGVEGEEQPAVDHRLQNPGTASELG